MKRSDFYIEAYVHQRQIYGKVNSRVNTSKELEYAFYLYKGNERKDTKWYSSSQEVRFDIQEDGIFKIAAFIKYNSEPLIIESNYVQIGNDSSENNFRDTCYKYKDIKIQPIEYWKSMEPFSDFSIISSKNKNIEIDKLLLNLNVKCNISKIEIGNNINYVLSSVELKHNKEIEILSGLGKIGDKLYFGQKDIINTPQKRLDMGKEVGIFTYLYANNQNIFITQDYFGCGIIFYYQNEDIFITSNRYHFLISLLANLKVEMKINKENLIASLGAKGNYRGFLGQNIFHEMDIKGVYQLPLNKEILIDKTGWRILDKLIYLESIPYSQGSYEELLQQAAEEIIQNIKCIEAHPHFKNIICDLSGGMDSRVVFGAVLNGDNPEKIKIRTKDIPNTKDLSIGVGLANFFGFDFYYNDNPIIEPIQLKENEYIWRSYFLGCYHRMGITAYSSKSANTSQIRLSGACGEYFRSFWSKIIKNVDEFTIQQVSEEIFNDNIYEYDAKKRICRKLREELESLPGCSTAEKLEMHYMFFRGRYHFGMRQFEMYHDCSMWFPLLSPALLKASRMLSLEERKEDKIMYEITERLCPLLIYMEYDNRNMIEPNKLNIAHKQYSRCQVKLDENIDRWKKIEEKNSIVKNQEIARKDIQYFKNVTPYLYNKVLEGYVYLYNNHHEVHDIINEQLFLNIQVNKDDNVYIKETYSKIYSLIDQIILIKDYQS